ncbi:MAG: hypothetical protein KDC95_01330 [Planctomycetes bacterium]|nr:hypothetical protein [Planctomycetota bacterium]
MREDDMLRLAFEPTIRIASHVELPAARHDLGEIRASAPHMHERPSLERPRSHALRPFLAGSLSAAVVFAIGCLALWPRADSVHEERLSASPSKLLERYVEAGRGAGTFIEELPRIPIGFESSTADDAKPHVLFIRRFIERAEVEGAYRLANNEHGDVIPVQLPHATIPVARKL